MEGSLSVAFGNGVQKFVDNRLEDTTDFLFSIICEELGMPECLIVVLLYIALIWAGLKILLATTKPFQRLLAFGIILTISVQAIVNLMVVTGLAPTKGIALPLLSSGRHRVAHDGVLHRSARFNGSLEYMRDRASRPVASTGPCMMENQSEVGSGPNILIIGGGSGGHISPGLAVAETISTMGGHCHVLCSERTIDRSMLEGENVSFQTMPARPFSTRPAASEDALQGDSTMLLGCEGADGESDLRRRTCPWWIRGRLRHARNRQG